MRPGEQGPPAALDIEDEVAVDENDDSTGLATRLVAAFGLPGRPGQGGTIGIGRVGRREDHDLGLVGPQPASAAACRSASTAPVVANWAAPSPSTK